MPFGDLEAVEAAIGPETAAIMVEPVQGEGGVRVGSNQFLQGLRKLCDEHGLLLVLDEVQCGMGRTGKLFAYEWAGITPDVMAVAKGIGGGFPVGCFMATEEAAKGMVAGTHGSTYGGNPLAMAVGNAVLDAVLEPGFLDSVRETGAAPQAGAGAHQGRESRRGGGGARQRPAGRHQGQAADGRGGRRRAWPRSCSPVGAGENVVRLLPPLNVTEAEIAEAVQRSVAALKRVLPKAAPSRPERRSQPGFVPPCRPGISWISTASTPARSGASSTWVTP